MASYGLGCAILLVLFVYMLRLRNVLKKLFVGGFRKV